MSQTTLLITLGLEEFRKIIQEEIAAAVQNKPALPTTPLIYITRKKLAAQLSLSLTTLDKYTQLGYLHAYRVGGRILYKSIEVEKALKEEPTINSLRRARYK